MRTTRCLLAALGVFALTACGTANADTADGSPKQPANLIGTYAFKSVDADADDEKLMDDSKATLKLSKDHITVGTDCNRHGGTVDTSDGVIKPGQLTGTLKGCAGDAPQQEKWVLKLINAKPKWHLDDEKLTLTSKSTKVTLKKTTDSKDDSPKQPANLKGTYEFKSVDADADDEKLMDDSKATLKLSKDHITVGTDCNRHGGTVDTSDGVIKPGQLTGTLKGCAGDAPQQEKWVLKLINAKPKWHLDDEKLTLTSKSTKVTLKKTTDSKDDSPKQPANLKGTYEFKSVDADADDEKLMDDSKATLRFSKDHITVGTDCNGHSGTVDTSDGVIKPGQLTGTLKACAGDAQKQEKWVLKLINAKPTWHLDGETLTLTSKSTKVTLNQSS